MSFVAVAALTVVLLIRPMELSPVVAQMRLLETLTLLAAVGIGKEIATKQTRIGVPPHLHALLAFVVWTFAVTIVRIGGPKGFSIAWSTVGLGSIFMVLVAYAVSTLERLRAFVAVVAATLAFILGITIHQGTQPRQCIQLVFSSEADEDPERIPDGRECEGAHWCEQNGKDGADYMCERVGLLETVSTMGRVRYRGQLDDPNEFSVFIGAMLPFMVVLGIGRSRSVKGLLLMPLMGMSLLGIVLAQSRTGQILVAMLLTIGLVRRFGIKGLVFAAAAGLPVMMVGGREGAAADSSSLERASILYEGFDIFRAHPFIGVGTQQFLEEMSFRITAHNSYLLAATELGFPGLLLWGGLLWIGAKTAIVVATAPPPGTDPDLVRFAEALAASFAAFFVGIFFLSFCYKQLLFVWLGLAAGLHGAVRRHAPDFQVRTTWKDLVGLTIFSIVILAIIFVIGRVKGA